MNEKELESIFCLAGIEIEKKYELMNQYWPRPEIETYEEYKKAYKGKNNTDENIYKGWQSEYMRAASYWRLVVENPWWLVKTKIGLITIGPRKRVINIDWSETQIRKIISEDDVTKSEIMIHAYSLDKCVEYLKALKKADEEYQKEIIKSL